jgi:endoglucanase
MILVLSQRLPGRVNEDYAWPTQSSVDYFLNLRFNTFRIPFLLERISPSATGGFEYGYLNKLKEVVEYLTGRGAYVILDPHNQMRYQGQLITSTDAFYQWWVRFAAEFRSNPRVAFEVMNAPDGLNATIVAQLNQAAINGIRAANASQLIILEGTNKSTASAWYTSGNADAFRSIRDPSNNFAFGVRQYFNYNNDGNGDDCVSATIGAERIRPFHDWLIINGQKGFLVEYGGGSDCTFTIRSLFGAILTNTLC